MKLPIIKLVAVISAAFLFAAFFTLPAYAVSGEQSAAIQRLLDDACRVSGAPGVSISVISKDETLYISSGYANRENASSANEETLYELASVSKAFTAAGILLLDERGLLSMSDPVQKYLPWFSLTHNGQPIDTRDLTLNNFLHHTSGLTNGKHIASIPQGDTPNMLRKTVEALTDAETPFYPGERYEYGTANYDVLGLVIEVVSGQSYEDFMTTQVLRPLGLHNTYVYSADAEATGKLAQGYRTSFFITAPYNTPAYAGNKPAGYIISSASDMARWIKIQMGMASGVPGELKTVIEKSHNADTSVEAVNSMYYAGGWSVNSDGSIIEHSGQNPTFAAEVAILPDERFAICMLSNNANMNAGTAFSVKEILDGNLNQS